MFWAYLDDRGKIYVKRYMSDRVIENYERMPYCKGIFGPFEAYDLEHAKLMVKERYAREKRSE